jgi:hypothetical protein
LTQQYQKNFLQYSKIQGPLSHINFTSMWEENVKVLIKKNPHLRFRKANIETTTMEYRIKDLPLLPAAGSIMGIPVNDAKEIVKGRILFPQFPLEIKGRVNLSILAACPASFPEDFDIVLAKPHTLRFEALFNF